MRDRGDLRRALAGVAAGAAVAALAVPVAAPVSAVPVAGAQGRESFTVLLHPGDAAGYAALLTVPGLSAHDRRDFLRQVGPSATTRRTVVDKLTALGLTVDATTAWSVRGSGPARVVDALLGDRAAQRAADRAAARAGRRVAATAAGSVPALLAGLADAVVGGNDTAPVVHRMAVPQPQSGASLRTLYHAQPGTPVSGHPALTVATLQFSGWNSADLTYFAANHPGGPVYPDPVASGQYQGISVDGASVSGPDASGGDVEVALDQESLLDVAPAVRQRAYVAPNTSLGFVDALEQVAADAAGSTPGLVALSISWGGCENPAAGEWAAQEINDVHVAMSHVVAAGVTVFAASGDRGRTGCQTGSALSVSYPASDPLVVGVGGTTVNNDGTQTGWGNELGASGGGYSTVFARPDYQAGSGAREVPDIAADGDPKSGMPVYAHYGGAAAAPSWGVVGGTSLSSPVAAGMFAAQLAAQGTDSGIGDVHGLLYAAPATAFTDITSGSNGYAAGAGYDLVTGLGTPRWDVVGPLLVEPVAGTVAATHPWSRSTFVPVTVTPSGAVAYSSWAIGLAGAPRTCPIVGGSVTPPTQVAVPGDGSYRVWVEGQRSSTLCDTSYLTVRVDTHAPSARATAALTSATGTGITARWSGTDPAPASGVDHYAVTVTHAGSSTPDASFTTRTVARSFAGVQGRTYAVAVRAVDVAGNATATAAVARVAVPLDDAGFARRGFSRVASASSYLGGYSVATSSAASASRSIAARSYTAWFQTCPTCGRVRVYIDGRLVRTIDTYSSTTRSHVPFALWVFPTSAARTVLVKPTGSHSAASRGNQVRFDAVAASA